MNRTVEAIKNGQTVDIKDLLEIVNVYDLTHVSLMNDEGTIVSMQVNRFETYGDVYELSQECAADHNKLVIKKDEIVSYESDWNRKANALFITCHMKNGMNLTMLILFPNDSFKVTVSEAFYETDVYEIKDFLDDVLHEKNDWYIILAKITDVFGFDLKMRNPFRTFVNTLSDDWKLHISDDSNVLEVPVTDDCVNLFYMKETDSTKEILVKPYGQPFTEIKLLLFKKHDKSK